MGEEEVPSLVALQGELRLIAGGHEAQRGRDAAKLSEHHDADREEQKRGGHDQAIGNGDGRGEAEDSKRQVDRQMN